MPPFSSNVGPSASEAHQPPAPDGSMPTFREIFGVLGKAFGNVGRVRFVVLSFFFLLVCFWSSFLLVAFANVAARC
jgi:hypothetical protein